MGRCEGGRGKSRVKGGSDEVCGRVCLLGFAREGTRVACVVFMVVFFSFSFFTYGLLSLWTLLFLRIKGRWRGLVEG